MTGPVEAGREAAARSVVSRYAHTVDARDFDGCIALFAADATLVLNGQEYAGRDAIRGWLDSLGAAPPGLHLTSNTVVWEEDALLQALSAFAFVRRGEAGWAVVAGGRYRDRFTDTGGSVRFLRREIEVS